VQLELTLKLTGGEKEEGIVLNIAAVFLLLTANR
jgi:hypothetical protein